MASSTYSTSEVLLREITHRVNNEFASAIQVLSFAAAKSPDRNVKAALAGVIEQLHNYARVHRALQMPAGSRRWGGLLFSLRKVSSFALLPTLHAVSGAE